MSKIESNTKRIAFKDYFDKSAALALAGQVTQALPSFQQSKFVRLATHKQ